MLVVAEHEQLPISQARAGMPEAWDALFKRYQLPLYVYVFELVGDEQTALDIVQETFIQGVRYIGTLRQEEKFGGWLFGIAHQRCVQHWRKSRKRWGEEPLESMAEELPELEEGPVDLLIRREQEAWFMSCLNELPPVQRSVLLLHYIEEFSLEQIAEITGSNTGTVKSRLHYAKKALRHRMEENAS